MSRINEYRNELLIVLSGVILFIPFLGGVHLFDWDEINFAESAREMIVTGNYLTVSIDYVAFWEKPPLFIWFQVLSMKLFGINEFAARFPNAVCGIITLIVIYRLGKRIYDEAFGRLWVLAYAGSILPFLYFKSGIIDPWFNLFIFLGLIELILVTRTEEKKERLFRTLFSGLFIGLAIMTKGPVGFLLFFLTVGAYWVANRFRIRLQWRDVLLFLVVCGLVGSSWFILQVVMGQGQVILDFITYQLRLLRTQDAGHGGFLLYHFVIVFIGVFPASVFALKGFKRNYYDNGFQKKIKIWMIVLLVVVLAVFTIVRTKIVHYSSLSYFPLTYLAAYTVYKIINKHVRNFAWMNFIYVFMAMVYGLVITAIPFALQRKEQIIASGWISDEFARAQFQADVAWYGWEAFIGLLFIAGVAGFVILLGKRKSLAYHLMFVNVAIMVFLTSVVMVPRAEAYSQRALIEFCKDRRGEECYLHTLRMKSYAPLFYAEKAQPVKPESRDKNWLLEGDVDKPVYFIVRNKDARPYLEQHQQLTLYAEKNGYVFLKREVAEQAGE